MAEARYVDRTDVFKAEHENVVEDVKMTPKNFKAGKGEPNDPDRTLPEGGWRKGPGDAVMFRPGPFGWAPRVIKANLISVGLQNGDLPHCGDCNEKSCDGNPNHCPGKENVATRRCPVCQKQFFDFDTAKQIRAMREAESVAFGEEKDPNEIQDDMFAMLTPETRTRALLMEHLEWTHPREARAILQRPLHRDSIDPFKIPARLSMAEAMETMGSLG